MNRGIHQRIGTIATVALLAVACGGTTAAAPSSSAGNADTKAGQNKLVLTIVTGEGNPEEARWYVDAVAEESAGTIEIKIDNSRSSAGLPAEYETDVIKDVADGKAELGFTGARAFDTVGVTSFMGLNAPFLIDSYDLEAQVIATDWANELLAGTRPAGVVGIGYIQGPMRRPLGITRELVDLADYNGARIGIRPSVLTEMTMKALGAVPVAFAPGDSAGLDGMEAHLNLIRDSYGTNANSLTGNVIFWSRPGVIFANIGAFDGLTPDQQDILRRASTRANFSERESVLSAGGDCCRSRSGFLDPRHRRRPRTESPAAESGALTLDIGRPSVTQLNRDLGEGHVLEVPAPAGIDLRARDDAAVRDPRGTAVLRRPRSGDLTRGCQRDPKGFVRNGERHDGARRWSGRCAAAARVEKQRREQGRDQGRPRIAERPTLVHVSTPPASASSFPPPAISIQSNSSSIW